MPRLTGIQSAPAITPENDAPAGSSLPLDHLKKSSKVIDQILRDNPGVAKFLERNRAAIHQVRPGDVQTAFDWPVWTHSPKSGGLTKANEKDIIVVWQEVPGSAARVQFGSYYTYPGEIIAIHRVDLRDSGIAKPSAAIDDGYIWPNMTVTASGPKGTRASMQWAVVTIDKDGNVTGGGYPPGWAGRSFTGVHGTVSHIPLKN